MEKYKGKGFLRQISGNSKYSKNLYEFLVKNSDCTFVKFLNSDFPNEKKIVIKNVINSTYLVNSDMAGSCLSEILRKGKRAVRYSYTYGITGMFSDYTEGFWEEYIQKGVCLTDSEHNFYEERWKYSKNKKSRVCLYCGREEVLKIKKITTFTEVWKEVKV